MGTTHSIAINVRRCEVAGGNHCDIGLFRTNGVGAAELIHQWQVPNGATNKMLSFDFNTGKGSNTATCSDKDLHLRVQQNEKVIIDFVQYDCEVQEQEADVCFDNTQPCSWGYGVDGCAGSSTGFYLGDSNDYGVTLDIRNGGLHGYRCNAGQNFS